MSAPRALRSLRRHLGREYRAYATTAAGPIPQPTFPGVTNPKPPATGQPLARSHAHLVRPGELTPGITAAEYEDRRRRLMDSLPAGSVVVCMGGTVRLVSQRESQRAHGANRILIRCGMQLTPEIL